MLLYSVAKFHCQISVPKVSEQSNISKQYVASVNANSLPKFLRQIIFVKETLSVETRPNESCAKVGLL